MNSEDKKNHEAKHKNIKIKNENQLFDAVLGGEKIIYGPFGEEDSINDKEGGDTSLDWWLSKPLKAEQDAFDDNQAVIKKKLAESKISFNFEDSTNLPTFENIITMLSQRINVAFKFHSDVHRILNEHITGMNLRFDNISVESALSTLLTLKGLTYVLEQNSIYIKPREATFQIKTENYRVQQLLTMPVENTEAKSSILTEKFNAGSELPQKPKKRAAFKKQQLIELIQNDIAPHTWVSIPKVSAALAGGKLIISHLPPIQTEIKNYVEMLMDLQNLTLEWEANLVLVNQNQIDELGLNWKFILPQENAISNPIRFSIVDSDNNSEFLNNISTDSIQDKDQCNNFQTAQLRLLKSACFPEQLGKDVKMPTGVVINLTPKLYPHKNLINLLIDLHFAICTKKHQVKISNTEKVELPQQIIHKISGRLMLPLKKTLLLRDFFNPFPDDKREFSLLVIKPKIQK